jgi:hypothetical protein
MYYENLVFWTLGIVTSGLVGIWPEQKSGTKGTTNMINMNYYSVGQVKAIRRDYRKKCRNYSKFEGIIGKSVGIIKILKGLLKKM